MPRIPRPAVGYEATVRAHFGLSMRQLARLLGVSVGFVGHLEAGRKQLPLPLALRLLPLGRLLPPPLGQGLPAPAPPPLPELPVVPPQFAFPASLEPEPLRRRIRDCHLKALVLGQRLDVLLARAAALDHRRWGLVQLTAAPPPPDPAEAAHYAHWLAGLAEDLALDDPQPAAAATQRALLVARVSALQFEIDALGGLSNS
ncbi:helix-turn-helix domain-containing protein [Hymenobacter terrenus]|uniref:helix-turn-helix domain-containing protein n=1 Tax=Hymenobacter terrenus TaxID=1629124 RepID=UPI0006197A0A|nr:helix-turn-helix transcriptional regulator [Hymenobacter terrenus]